MDGILHGQPEAIARFNYNVPPELERIMRKCLEKDRERRYQSARELLIDLRNLKRDGDSGEATAVGKLVKPSALRCRGSQDGMCGQLSWRVSCGVISATLPFWL